MASPAPSTRLRTTLAIGIVLLLAAAILGVRYLSDTPRIDRPEAHTVTKAEPKSASAPPEAAPDPASHPDRQAPATVADLAEFVRSAGQTNSSDQMFAEIAKLNLIQTSWWRSATDFSELLALALDSTLPEDARIVALRLFLAGIPEEGLRQQAHELQKSFDGATDRLVSALLQDMADRKVAPESLIRSTLANPSRGEHAKCMAWYSARLTGPANLELAALALDESQRGLSTVSKVAFDYLAAGSLAEPVNNTPSLRHKVDEQVDFVTKLPVSAEIIELANADAFISAIPSLMDSERSKQVLLETLHNALNPEIRISALEQIVRRQTSREKDVESELAAIRKNLPSLFPDEAKQIRASAILKRAASSPIPQKNENE